jgi:1-aminocyclopropane-1-carboxylate deaminase/D-cysteine desulfhydrase-like pyridoxal-dependent ACC family enzyme
VDALRRLAGTAHQRLGFYPTPLEQLDRLRAQLEGAPPRLLIKRDDYTGFALGGNKVRKLEYELAPERVRPVDVLITAGGYGSNHCRVTAAAAAHLGKRCILVQNGTPPDPPRGNALLQRLFGAESVHVADRAQRTATMQDLAADLERAGQRSLIVPLGASTPRGALGYVRAALELAQQLRDAGINTDRTTIVLSASSAGTLAGLLAGLPLAGLAHAQLLGVSPDDPAAQIRDTAREIAQGAADLLAAPLELPGEQPTVNADFVGEGYGIPTRASRAAIDLFARTEGIVLDPVYTAKAAACLIEHVRSEQFHTDDVVIFWHTGGHPALF